MKRRIAGLLVAGAILIGSTANQNRPGLPLLRPADVAAETKTYQYLPIAENGAQRVVEQSVHAVWQDEADWVFETPDLAQFVIQNPVMSTDVADTLDTLAARTADGQEIEACMRFTDPVDQDQIQILSVTNGFCN